MINTIEYRTVDKSEWPRGAWDDEPDKKQWADEETGYPCLIVRNSSGALCGYVGVNDGHPLYKKEPDWGGMDDSIEVHGGITFSSHCRETKDEGTGICHVSGDDADPVWWLGFDCCHSNDLIPLHKKYMSELDLGIDCTNDVYRDFTYVTAEITALAKQLKKL